MVAQCYTQQGRIQECNKGGPDGERVDREPITIIKISS